MVAGDGRELGAKLKDGFFEDGCLFGGGALFGGDNGTGSFVFDL